MSERERPPTDGSGTAAPRPPARDPRVAAEGDRAGGLEFEAESRLALRTILLLRRAGPPDPYGLGRPEMTQRGLAVALAVSQGAISKLLRRLEAADVVARLRCHVPGERRRVWCYGLTLRGSELAGRYFRRAGHLGTDRVAGGPAGGGPGPPGPPTASIG